MKTIMKAAAVTTLLSCSTLYAGGKIIAPAVAPVAMVEESSVNPLYLGLGLLWGDTSRECYCYDLQGNLRDVVRTDDDAWGGIVRLGYDFNQYVGIETRFLSASLGGGLFDTTHYGIFLKPKTPIGERFNLYGLLGYGHTKIETDCGVVQESYSKNGFSYGIGLEYDLSSKDDDYESYTNEGNMNPEFDRPFDGHGDQEVKWGLWVDYQKLLHDEGAAKYRSHVVTFGVTYDF
ncbi:MAG: porin family protein [Sulfurovum sp.]